jgi:hypothetical protein
MLYSLYDSYDLRKIIFFRSRNSNMRFYGSYGGSIAQPAFGGIATDEIYLIKAECLARMNKVMESMEVLNKLLSTRWITGTFMPQAAVDRDEALSKIVMERRKELIFRGLRWEDLRRLNPDPKFSVTLMRSLDGQTYDLPPNDLKYIFPIPQNEIDLSGIQQSPR